eukprot:GHRR01002575.1.p1 GENE.GHRR01002575.1~~GHRR01002575.1.p1  ORF type:complete len:266 (+),score=97.83 GHRR01002575.1:285-1082(+)
MAQQLLRHARLMLGVDWCSCLDAGFGCTIPSSWLSAASKRLIAQQQTCSLWGRKAPSSREAPSDTCNYSNSSAATASTSKSSFTAEASSSFNSGTASFAQQQSQQQQVIQQQKQPSASRAIEPAPRQPLPIAAYGPRKVTPLTASAAPGSKKREGIVHINSTFNNTIIVLTDRDSMVQTWTSGGTVGYKNANKATPIAAELAAKELAKRAVDLGFHSVVVKVKGMGRNKQFAVQSLAANGLTVTQLWDVTPIPYNGCRLPRRRRV